MNDLTAIEDESADSREFIGNAHSVNISADGVTISNNIDDSAPDTSTSNESNIASEASSLEVEYKTSLKHFREILEDWEAFILDEEDPIDDSMHV